MDNDMSPTGDKCLTKEFFDLDRRIPKQGARRQTRQAASHVDFRADSDLERIPEDDENSRRKRRSKTQHCPSCHCQSFHENTPGSRLNDTLRRKNPEKLEATLNQHLDYTTSKIGSNAMKNIHGRAGPPSPRNRTVQQCSQHQYHRPGTSVRHCQDRNNLGSATNQRHPRKYGNAKEQLEYQRLDSQLRDIVNSDVGTEETDFRLPCEQMDTRKFGKPSSFRWHSPPGEPHLEPEMDSPDDQRRGDCSRSKRWHSGQGESLHDDRRVGETEPWMETTSTDARDDWQYERDQRELKDLCEGVRQYAKRKSAGCNRHQREETEREDDSRETLEKINRLFSKLPMSRQGNAARAAAARTSSVGRQPRTRSPTEQVQLRNRTSKTDALKAYHSSTMDGRNWASSRDQEVGRDLDDESFDIELESFGRVEENKEEEDEAKEDAVASETEEEARQLAIKETEIDRLERQSSKISDEFKLGRKKKNKRELSEWDDEKEERDCEKSIPRRRGINAAERRKGNKEMEAKMHRESKLLTASKQNCYARSDSEVECTDEKRTKSRERSGGKRETEETTCEESKHNCYRMSCVAKDLELETSKTKNCIDEMIDRSLSRETKRGSAETLRATKKDVQHDVEVSKQVPSRRGIGDEPSKITRDDSLAHKFSRETERLPVESIQGDGTFDARNSRACVRELKNCRWAYLNHMRSDLRKLFDLERYLDSCSPERHASLPTVTTEINAEAKETDRPPEK